MPELKGRTFLVTGAGGNVGRAAVQRLLADGAKVAGLDHHEPHATGAFVGIGLDLTQEGAVAAAFATAEQQLGPIWAVLHIAGGWQGGVTVADTTVDAFETMLSRNLRTSFVVGREAMRRMVPRKEGRIVMVGSLTAATFTHLSGSGAYNVSKAGVIALTRVLAEEGAPHGVFANAIAPTTIATSANRDAMPKADESKWVPIEAVVDALLSVASPRSGVNGATLTLTGRG